VLRVLRSLEYDGPVVCEPFSPARDRLGEMPADDAAAQVTQCMKRLFEQAGVET
jgi:hypothetical protein